MTNYGKHEVWVKGKMVEDFPHPAPTIPDSPGHLREFLDAIKSRNLETTCNVRYGHRAHETGVAVEHRVSHRPPAHTGTTRSERFVGDGDANRYLSRKFRKPYTL